MTTCRGSGSMSFLSVSRPWSLPSVPEKMKRRKLQTVNMKSDWGVIFGYCLSLRRLLWNMTVDSFLDIDSQYLLRGEGDRRCLEGELRSDLRLSTGEGLLSYKLKFIFFLTLHSLSYNYHTVQIHLKYKTFRLFIVQYFKSFKALKGKGLVCDDEV